MGALTDNGGENRGSGIRNQDREQTGISLTQLTMVTKRMSNRQQEKKQPPNTTQVHSTFTSFDNR